MEKELWYRRRRSLHMRWKKRELRFRIYLLQEKNVSSFWKKGEGLSEFKGKPDWIKTCLFPVSQWFSCKWRFESDYKEKGKSGNRRTKRSRKNNFLKMLAGLAAPTKGEIELFGRKGRELGAVRSRIGCLIEAPGSMETWPHTIIWIWNAVFLESARKDTSKIFWN